MISFAIPCYRSEKTIVPVIDEVITTMSERGEYDYEIVLVNDRSPDNVFNVIRNLAQSNKRIKAIDLSHNMGQHGALMAAYSFCKGDIVVSMDDDGQSPVNCLWELIDPILENKADVSIADYGQRKKESAFRNFGSWVNDKMAGIMLNKPDTLKLSSFFAMKRFVKDEVIRYSGPYPYVTGLVLRSTQNIVNVPISDRERLEGKSGYTLRKLLHLFFNGFTSFSIKPLRFATMLGTLIAVLSFISLIVIVANKLINPDVVIGWSSLISVILLIGGLIMFMLGILGEYIGRIYICINNSPQYVIREGINLNEETSNNDLPFSK